MSYTFHKPLLRITCYIFLFSLMLVSRGAAQPQSELLSISPQGGQRGTMVEIALEGKNIGEATGLFISGEGLSAEIKRKTGEATVSFSDWGVSAHIESRNRVSAVVTIAESATLGIRALRVVTPNGVSNPIRFVVGDLPETKEAEPNATGEHPNPIELPITVSGQISSPDDLDVFSFLAKKGQRLSFEVTASRIGSPLDSLLILFSPDGVEVARNDIANGLDALIDYTAPADGSYTLQLRDVAYKGGSAYIYRLSVGQLPYLDSIFPLGAKRGTERRLALTGRNLAGLKDVQVSIAPDAPLGAQQMRLTTPTGLSTNALPFLVDDLPDFTESEPNDRQENANSVTSPVAINGKIEPAEDIDYFRFTVEAGQRLVFEVNARGLGSKLDALLTLLSETHASTDTDDTAQATESVLAVNDEAMGAEARIDYTFKSAGNYAISIRDLNNQGGADFPYRLNITPLRPDFRLTVTPDNPRVSCGSSTTLTINVERRHGFAGSLRFSLPGLPADFVVSPTLLSPDQNQALVSITVPIDAPLGLYPTALVGSGEVNGLRVERKAETDPVLLTVMEVPPFSLQVAEVSLNVVQSRFVPLHVSATRREGFVGPINLSITGLPGRASLKAATLAEGQTDAVISIEAGSFEDRTLLSLIPQPGTYYISATGAATVNNSLVTQSTPAIPLTVVEAPFVVTVDRIRLSIVLPSTVADTEPIAEGLTEEQAGTAFVTVTVVRQGGFTDVVRLVAVELPEGLTASETQLPEHEDEAKINLIAAPTLKPDTYNIKVMGSATINGQPFHQHSPTVAVKIIQ